MEISDAYGAFPVADSEFLFYLKRLSVAVHEKELEKAHRNFFKISSV
jgi:hypothetical protein